MIFPADGTLMNFFFLADVLWHPFVHCQLDSGSKWCTDRGYSKVFTCWLSQILKDVRQEQQPPLIFCTEKI
jgi:hypothetical protein